MATSAPTSTRSQFVLFALAGCVSFAVDAATLHALVFWLGWTLYAGRLGSYVVAVTASWLMNRSYAFRAHRSASLLREWGKFFVANSFGGGVNYTTYAVLIASSETVAGRPVLGVAAGSIAGLLVNFTLSRAYVFRRGRT